MLGSTPSIARRVRNAIALNGVLGTAAVAVRRLTRAPLGAFAVVAPRTRGRVGLEIGGPSVSFGRGGLLPVYPIASRVDNTNFGAATIWEGAIDAGRTFRFDPAREPGVQFLLDATALTGIVDGTYDFVLSCHALEHVANPLKALAEWRRVLTAGGTLVLMLPHRDATFDHRRPVTPLSHLRDDFDRGTGEDDLTHLAEVLALHDLARDSAAGGAAAFRARCEQNPQNRGMHHHTFTTAAAVAMVDAAGYRVLEVGTARPFHIVVVAERPADAAPPDNAAHLDPGAPWRRASPFAGDRAGDGR